MNLKKPRKNCKNCGKECSNSIKIYCSNKCQQEFYKKVNIQKWLNGELKTLGTCAIRNYLLEKQEERCIKCGWGERNIITNKVPLELEHIDGDWRNNSPDNVMLLCPNCHSLTPTFRALNKRPHDRKVKGQRKRW